MNNEERKAIGRFHRNWYSPGIDKIVKELTFNQFSTKVDTMYLHIDALIVTPAEHILRILLFGEGAMPRLLGHIKGIK